MDHMVLLKLQLHYDTGQSMEKKVERVGYVVYFHGYLEPWGQTTFSWEGKVEIKASTLSIKG